MQLARKRSLWVLALVCLSAPATADDTWQLGSDILVYSDTDNVLIVSPQTSVRRTLDEDGGEVSARVVLDAVSAASVDVVSQATTRFSELRSEVNLGVAKPLGGVLPSLRYRYSHEPDYDSHGMGVGVQRELRSPDTTLALAYDLALDTVGYTGTPNEAFAEALRSHILSASLTQVLDPKTLLRGVYTLSVQTGYMEKPYRHVPLFDEAGLATARAEGEPINLATFDRYRLDARPSEEVPDRRVGHAIGGRALRYLGGLPGSIRLDAQLFADSWGSIAGTLEPSLHWKQADTGLWTVYLRGYAQRAVDFWRREYLVDAAGAIPRWRTLDRDLSSYFTVMGGLRQEWRAGILSGYADLSIMDTRYANYIFLDSRFALTGQLGLRVDL